MTFEQFVECFNFDNKSCRYHYLGYTFPPFKENTIPYNICVDFFMQLEKMIKPWWCPWWLLNLLYLIGNDNSVVRVENWFFHNLRNRIMSGFLISDMKIKYGTMRIYFHGGSNESQELCDSFSKKLHQYCEIY